MAVDYSGECGAPCLIVMADSVRGGGSKLWAWQLQSRLEAGPPTTRSDAPADGAKVVIE